MSGASKSEVHRSGSTRPLRDGADEGAEDEKELPLDDFELLMHRSRTPGEAALFEELGRSTKSSDDVWFSGAIPESAAAVAATLVKSEGRRVLLVSLDADRQNEREVRLLHRVPLRRVSGDERTKSRLPEGPLLVLADARAPDARALETLQRSFAGEEFDFVFVDGVEGATARSPDFRPAFGRVFPMLDRLRAARLVFFGGHVTADVRRACRLLRDGRPYVELGEPLDSFDLRVAWGAGAEALVRVVDELPRPAWIVCASPQIADRAYSLLSARQVPCHRYHAAMSPAERASELMQFALPGRRAVLIATSSFAPAAGAAAITGATATARLAEHFGAGYGRADLRTVLHLGLPASLEQLAAECGVLAREATEETLRARRTERSRVLVLVDEEWDDRVPRFLDADASPPASRTSESLDRETLERVLDEDVILETLVKKRPSADAVAAIVGALSARSKGQVTPEEDLLSIPGFSKRALSLGLGSLVEYGLVGIAVEGGRRVVSIHSNSTDTATSIRARLGAAETTLREAFDELARGDRMRRGHVIRWALGSSCRRSTFLSAFGFASEDCGNCDVCAPLETRDDDTNGDLVGASLAAFYEARTSRERRASVGDDDTETGPARDLAG